MIIMCDIDCILNDLVSKTIDLFNKRFNKSITMDDMVDYNFYNCIETDDADKMLSLFNDSELLDSLKPLEGSQDGLKNLVDSGNEVYIATATNPENFNHKIKWLKRYYPFFNTDNVICIKNKALLDCDIIIDDHLENLKPCIREKICLDYLWNRNEHVDFIYGIHRVYNWKQIVDKVNEIKKEYEEI